MTRKTGWAVSLTAILAAIGGLMFWPEAVPHNGPSQLYAQQVAEAELAESDLIGAERLSSAFRAASKVLKPSVVQIGAMVERRPMRSPQNRQFPFDSPFGRDLLEEFFGQPNGRRQLPSQPDLDEEAPPNGQGPKIQAGVGSGVIVAADGYILTNNHVVEAADELQIELSDGRSFKAEIVGRDPRSDLAVLKIDATGLVAARMGDSSAMEVGDWVIAVGSPFGLEQTVTAGIISATNRHTGIIRGGYEDFLQTDAAINPGNSGGPLVNLRGEVIGINTAINSRTGTNAGVGFAIPSNMAMQIMQDLQRSGRVVRGFIGAALEELTAETSSQLRLPENILRGAIIRRVLPNGPAARADLQVDDVVVAASGRSITSSAQLMNQVAMTRPGSPIDLKVFRKGNPIDVRVVVEEQTDERMAQFSDRTVIEDWGLTVDTINPQIARELNLPEQVSRGAVVLEIDPRNRAAQLGFQPGDVLLTIDGAAIATAQDAKAAFDKAGRQISLEVQRGRALMSITTNVP
jgi:serine protease Do